MPFERDNAKRVSNISKHGLDFASAEQFEWKAAVVYADTRRDYGEPRLIAIGPIDNLPGRLFPIVFTIERRATRIIGLRRASNREIRLYET